MPRPHRLLLSALAGLFPCIALAANVQASPKPVRFVAFGDAGTGNKYQYAVAYAMARVCADRGCDFALELGDNFYPEGVTSLDDPQFITKFEQPYAPLQLPVYVVLGNHDNGGKGYGGQNARGDFEVAYSSKPDRPSQMWHMPARYYSFTAPLGAPPEHRPMLEIFGLDSSTLVDKQDPSDPRWERNAYAEKQLAWFNTALAQSRARWKLAFAHHPPMNNAGGDEAGDPAGNRLWAGFLQNSLCKNKVALLLSGHLHNLQWWSANPACGKTEYIVSGGGGATVHSNENPFREHARWLGAGGHGFFWFEVRPARILVAAYVLQDNLRLPLDPQQKPRPAYQNIIPRR